MAYKMTARRRAALKKAQAASARKRRKGGKSTRAQRKTVAKNKRAYAKKNYRGRGGYSRNMADLKASKGIYGTNRHGKKVGKFTKRANKVTYYANYSPVAMAISKRRAKKRK